ncbi:laminin subunit alpha-1 [Heteronotia binoei]|uniref:laminin subunit alpha-1 n=1 Tax=Heteronotia binoei TaxID=13085 RepID=UPI0029306AB6|nr:laminin subunit alpha-1 [Heteronotia binoei]
MGCRAWLRVLAVVLLFVAAECQLRGLFPAILNLASNAHISTNATCGEKGPEMFCKLVEHVPGRPLRNAQCRICDHNSANPKEQHPISNAIDGTNNWWQSPSIQNGREYHWVTITLDLRQVFQVAYVIIKAANAPRPGNWILERSVDGIEFSPWQYYAISDTECLTRYNVTPRLGPPTYKRDDEVICTSYYSRLVPLEHGEIHTSLINGRPSADDPSTTLLEFTSARYIRLQLQRIRTLNADLMTLSHRDPKDVDPIVTRRYYYSIKDISVGGMCICYGHARSCPLDKVTKKLQCQCEHNTCGESCNECCPGYHQTPWRPGTISAGNRCEKCNCHNKAEDCYYDQSVADQKRSKNIHGQLKGGGVCINCTQQTTGINCGVCVDGYYRPHKVSPYDNNPCSPCECDLFGSLGFDCVKDDDHAELQHGAHPGQCQCKEGYAGEKCDHCAFGYKGYPNCVQCNCSLVGSINDDPCTEPCLCKENVEGENCDRCKPGFYNFQERNPQGCTECFCFGVSDVCESLPWPISQVSSMGGWTVTSPYTSKTVQPQEQFDGPHQISINNIAATKFLKSPYYWSAPQPYLGNKLTSYGGYLKYTVSYDIPMESTDSDLVSNVDVIIQGNGDILCTRSEGLSLQPYEEYSNTVRLVSENFIDFNTKKLIDRDILMTVLANVTRFLFRANYNIAKKAVYRLGAVTLDTANTNLIDLTSAMDVEYCECPQGYSGISCESCLPGYYRVSGILFGGICLPCSCNNHASECDIHGVCLGCKHNTTGHSCDQCLPGFYGIPSRGTPEDCQPCACPLKISTNNFSPTCHLDNEGEVTCDKCPAGYAGTKCERCANGYYGNPLVPGQSCMPCDCNGNVDTMEDGYCNSLTGECLKCIRNTAGHHCEKCADEFFGDAVTNKECYACECHPNSSVSSICHHETGLCQCKPNVIGQKCDRCSVSYYGLSTGLGCLPCNCSKSGSVAEDCSDEGQCRCLPGVAGDKCSHCAYGFYAFQEDGCTPCNCAHTQDNCDRDSGQCICPPHTEGEKCELCEENFWGLDPEKGCKECSCSAVGSFSLQCDLLTAQCQCKDGYGGDNCSVCALGYRDYPDCVPCDCDIRGTTADTCDQSQGVCSCEEDTGVCACKDNAFGLHCSECKTGTFALHASNLLGCIPCFCFGMSDFCVEVEDHVRIPITVTPEQDVLYVVSQSNFTGTSEGVFSQFPDILMDAATVRQHLNTEPFYWKLPDQFQGDQLMAYGGKLKYAVAFYALDGTGTSNLEPQVLMKGGFTNKQIIYVDIPAPGNGVKQEEEILMVENVWKYFNSVSSESVSRSDFMLVLSNVEYILIKASYGQGLQQSRISNVSMEIAIKADEMTLVRETAQLVEKCLCPDGYAGLSCQDCAPGYYREKYEDKTLKISSLLIPPCLPCQCNNHSETCDPQTGECLGCRDNTAGGRCNVCATGYYGKVTGSINDCSLCACPRISPGSFSPICVMKDFNDFHCSACIMGYEGQYCERCSPGYYGNPKEPDGDCKLCQCKLNGSVHNICDHLSGQCVCKQGVRGQLCDECEARHILVENECISCDDACTGLLLNDLDNLDKAMFLVNLTGAVIAPYGLLSDLENATKHLKGSILSKEASVYSVETVYDQVVKLTSDTDQMHKESSRILQKGRHLSSATERTLNKSQELTVFIETLLATVKVLVEMAASLNETLRTDLPFANRTFQDLQDEIPVMLNVLHGRYFKKLYQKTTLELKAAERILTRIQKEYKRPQQELLDLQKAAKYSLSNHNTRLQELKDLVNEASANTNETKHLLFLLNNNIMQFNHKKLNTLADMELSVMLTKEGKAHVDASAGLAKDVINSTSTLEIHQDELILWNGKLRQHVDNLVMEMSTRGALDLVYKAEDHAADLQKLAHALDSGLSNVRNVSLNATNAIHAYSTIKSLTENAESLADDADRIITEQMILPKEDFNSTGKRVLQFSYTVLKEAKNLHKKYQGLVSGLKEMNVKVEKCKEKADGIAKQLNGLLLQMTSLPNDTSGNTIAVKELAVSANMTAVNGLNHTGNFSEKLLNTSSALSKVNETLQKTSELIIDSSKAVTSAERKVSEVEIQAGLLFGRLKPLKVLEENLSRNISEIKELISQARKQAASIKVAVSAERDCIRAYQPQILSTNYNTLTLNVKTTEPDNLLFYLGSSGKTDFMAVEMRRGKVAFLWDMGSGSTRLEYSDFTINNNKWHRIHITRFGKTGTLSVEETNSSQKPFIRSAMSPGTATVLDVNQSTVMFIGGLGGQIKKSPAIKVTHFKGCMGEASLNGRSVGLWNYIEREGKCNGCFGSMQDEDTAFHFDGSGYSVVEKALRSTVTQIIVFFRTFSPSGLLVYLASNGTRDFLSLELVDGKVKLTVDLGSGPLTLKTERRYNNGTWYKISFSRNKKEGILTVMDAQNLSSKESKQGESPGAASDLNRSDKDPIYVAGLPRSRAVKKGITNRRYVGCIKNLEISRSTFDLLRNSYGVRKGCILEPIRTASILSSGYIELPPKPLSQESQLMATFMTKEATGIILVGLGKGSEKRRRRQALLPFFSIMLSDGHLAVHINPGDRGSTRKVIVQSTNGNYSDGQEHSVILTRNKRIITVQVDENSPAEIRLGPLAETSPMNISNFYIGGIPAGESILGVKMTGSFHGCITNLIFNMALLDFTTAVRYEGVDMDSCFLLEKPKSTIQPEDTEILSEMQMQSIFVRPLNNIKEKQCAEDDLLKQISGAHQFGLARSSHLVLLFNQTTVRKKFSVQINLRTFASSGLIYYMTHPKQVDFAALQLHGGKLYFSFDLGKGRAVAFHSAIISDGKWHMVKTEYAKRRGVIIVDGKESEAVNVPGDGITLDVDGKLYLGGLPLDYRAKNIGNITHSIPACIGEVTINSKQLDRESPVSSFVVNKCYATAQEGTFFDGNGFAALVKEGYKVRSDVNITFEFRTTSANGVLLGISSAKVDAIGVEIVNGKVLFCVNNGAGRITATYEPKGMASLCDGQWHKLQANKSKHQIALVVDGNLVQTDNPHMQSTSADTNNPIYVGGYPADVKQNCLASKSSFQGCLRNLLLMKSQQVESFDFSEAFDLHGVFPHSCPGAKH